MSFFQTSKGMTLIEMTAVVVVTSIIALGMTMGTRGVLLHYQTDHVRQDLRQYGNNITVSYTHLTLPTKRIV